MELETFFQILDQVRAEGLESVERPSVELRSEFGFGRSHGILLAVARIRTLVESEIKARTDIADSQENDFE